ncbi:DUF2381 family protein [Pyxidicoccus xibeiensis]|uniref:DUF2381 family protein n=1 Tax=Pyxidicoccus xibeiensis TaxID=2906759 RepID=UPI0020A7FFFB|nr:DUF2381 family protein [Pyxidicoccus xibeiensis]MCP3142649.1 DUF2381 family protein [Pyxidicoccus xibeiensis]
MSPLPGLVLALLSLMPWTAAAHPPSERTLRARRVPLTGAAAVDVRVAAGIPTTLNFDADINPLSVALEVGLVKVLSVAARAITLTPIAELDGAVTLRVRFADACSALEPVFLLRADAAEVDTQVTAYRDARAPELLLAQVAELEAHTAACEREAATLRERGRAIGPASLVLSGQIDGNGVKVADARCGPGPSPGGVECSEGQRFLAETWVVVSVWLRNSPGQPVWQPGRAWLVGESSRERIPARVVALEPEALAPDAKGTLAVEFTRPPHRPGEVYRVEVREAKGARHLSVSDVTVDDAATSGQKGHGP